MAGTETLVEVGRFTFDTTTEVLTGPREHFEARGGVGNAVQGALASTVFKFGLTESPSPQVAFLVALQTDYAAFAGEKSMRTVVALDDFGVTA